MPYKDPSVRRAFYKAWRAKTSAANRAKGLTRDGKPRKERKADPTFISRREAKHANFLRYYTGIPCRKGHLAERLVSNGSCLECVKNKTASDTHKAYMHEYHSQYNKNNRHTKRLKLNAWRAANRDKARAAYTRSNVKRRKKLEQQQS